VARLPILKQLMEEIEDAFFKAESLEDKLREKTADYYKLLSELYKRNDKIEELELELSLYREADPIKPPRLEEHYQDIAEGEAQMSTELYKEIPTHGTVFDYKHKKQC
jgi:predicted  nucleic acid-binding Zn-ribbon protein